MILKDTFMEYLQGKKEVKEVDFHTLCSQEFVLFFLDLMHCACENLLESYKSTSSLLTKEAQNDLKNETMTASEKHYLSQSAVTVTKPYEYNTKQMSSIIKTSEKEKSNRHRNQHREMFKAGPHALAGKDVEKIFFQSMDKSRQNHLDCRVNNSSLKPESRNFPTQSSSTLRELEQKRFDISSSDDFPILTSSQLSTSAHSKSKHKGRRIKPTLLTAKPLRSEELFCDKQPYFQNTKQTFGITNNNNETKMDSSLCLQPLICEHASKHLEPPSNETMSLLATTAKTKKVITNTESSLDASDIEKLFRLAHLHCYCMVNFLVPSIIAELHLLVMLLLLDKATQPLPAVDDSIHISMFNSTTKGRLFATSSLALLSSRGFLRLLNLETLTLLSSYISNNVKDEYLSKTISKELEDRADETASNIMFLEKLVPGAVPFKAETDDRSNFASDKAFYSFRKQRDTFYSLIHQWNDNQLAKDAASKEIVGQIHWLLSQVKCHSTYDAFLRLFLDHLIHIGTSLDGVVQPTSQGFPLVSLLNGDNEKFRRLEKRVTKASLPQKNSTRMQLHREFEFFQDFITIADSFTLNVRLCDMLKERISCVETENCQIDDSDAKMNEFDSIIQSIYHLRIYGNFYGLIAFLPYKECEKRRSGDLSHMEKSAAEFMKARLDQALQNGHLLLTIPWMVQCLYFVSAICCASDLYKDIFTTLCKLYRSLRSCGSSVSSLFLATLLCSLFEQDLFNDSLFYQISTLPSNTLIESPARSVDAIGERIISSNIIFEMHWRLGEIQYLLKSKSVSSPSERQLPRKIKPCTEKLPETSNLQTRLEASFFNLQPLSLKRTVAFVSERCLSNCVKHLCSAVLPAFLNKNEGLLRLLQKIDEGSKDSTKTREIATRVYPEVFNHLNDEAENFIRENVATCMKALSSSSLSETVLLTATSIASRQCLNSAKTWLRERLFDHLLSKVKLAFKSNSVIVKTSSSPSELINSESVSSIIHNLREFILENQGRSENTEEQLQAATFQLTIVARAISSSLDSDINELPRHVLSVFSYLVSELLSQRCSPPESSQNDKLSNFSLAEHEKRSLYILINDY